MGVQWTSSWNELSQCTFRGFGGVAFGASIKGKEYMHICILALAEESILLYD
jgi:hypothetical protein